VEWERIAVAQTSDTERYLRYQQLLNTLGCHDTFPLGQIKAELPDEEPSFVTRVVHELAKEGLLCETEPKVFQWSNGVDSFDEDAWLDQKIYGPRMTRTPESDRPRERLLSHGAKDLRSAELIAILVRSGRPGESALQAGEKVAARFAGRLAALPGAGRGELKAISPAVADTAYCQIMAGVELGRRVERATQESQTRERTRLRQTPDIMEYCRREFQELAERGTQEEFRLVCLDAKRHVIGLAEDLTTQFGRSFSADSLELMRRLYATYRIPETVSRKSLLGSGARDVISDNNDLCAKSETVSRDLDRAEANGNWSTVCRSCNASHVCDDRGRIWRSTPAENRVAAIRQTVIAGFARLLPVEIRQRASAASGVTTKTLACGTPLGRP